LDEVSDNGGNQEDDEQMSVTRQILADTKNQKNTKEIRQQLNAFLDMED
jgi:hypothetical protein